MIPKPFPLTLVPLALLGICNQCHRAEAAPTAPTQTITAEALDPDAARIAAEIRRLETTKPAPSPRKYGGDHRRHAPPPPEVVDGRPPTFTAGLKVQAPGSKDRDLLVVRHERRLLIRNRRLRTGILFEQNPVAEWQITAAAVDHPHRCVIDFNFVDLEGEGMPHRWEDLVGMGVRLGELDGLELDEATREAYGLVFQRMHNPAARPAAGDLLELWWNAEHCVPLELHRMTEDGVQIQKTVAFRFTHEAKNLRHPHEWMKQYKRVDLADFREEHLGCGKRVAQATRPGRVR